MTPLHLLIALHYHTRADDFPDFHITVCLQYARDLVAAGMLKENAEPYLTRFSATDGLKVYIDALLKVPFPVKKWVMPE